MTTQLILLDDIISRHKETNKFARQLANDLCIISYHITNELQGVSDNVVSKERLHELSPLIESIYNFNNYNMFSYMLKELSVSRILGTPDIDNFDLHKHVIDLYIDELNNQGVESNGKLEYKAGYCEFITSTMAHIFSVLGDYLDNSELLEKNNTLHAILSFKFGVYGYNITDQDLIDTEIKRLSKWLMDNLSAKYDVIPMISKASIDVINSYMIKFIEDCIEPETRDILLQEIHDSGIEYLMKGNKND